MIINEVIKDEDNFQEDRNGNFLSMYIGLPQGSDNTSHYNYTNVKRCDVDHDDINIGKQNYNLIINYRQYEGKHINRSTEILAANTITENIINQANTKGHKEFLLGK